MDADHEPLVRPGYYTTVDGSSTVHIMDRTEQDDATWHGHVRGFGERAFSVQDSTYDDHGHWLWHMQRDGGGLDDLDLATWQATGDMDDWSDRDDDEVYADEDPIEDVSSYDTPERGADDGALLQSPSSMLPITVAALSLLVLIDTPIWEARR